MDPNVYLPKGLRTNNMRAFSTTYTILGALPSSASEERKTTRTCSRQTKITQKLQVQWKKKGLCQGKLNTYAREVPIPSTRCSQVLMAPCEGEGESAASVT